MNSVFKCLTRDTSGDEKQYFERFVGRKKRTPNRKKIKINWGKKKQKEKTERKYKRVPKQYKVYIKSHWWEKRKNEFWKKNRKICYRCQSSSYIQLHHIKYKSSDFGREKDTDLIPMCNGCHNLFHSLYGTKKDMNEDMLLFEQEHPHIF